MTEREHFTGRLAIVLSMIGVAVGLGNVWRFPYMVGSFGGGAFVLVYLVAALGVGVPALMAEWALGRHTRRGTVGAFERGGLPGGRAVGWFFFVVVTAATAYYVNVIGWVGWHALVELATPIGRPLEGAWILPPETGVDARALLLQGAGTIGVLAGCAVILLGGLRRGIERASLVLTPLLFGGLLVLVVRSLTLPGAGEGVRWLFDFDPAAVTPAVVLAALSQVIFSLALGGTFMVVYGSYLADGEALGPAAIYTVLGDTGAGLLAGLAVVPAVFAFGLEPGSGPGLLFATLPEVLGRVPGGWGVGGIFFLALGGAAFLSAVAALEVLVAGLTDNTGLSRRAAVGTMTGAVFLLAIPPMINMRIFVPWDLTFGSGMQTLGALVAALTFGWALDRATALRALASGDPRPLHTFLHLWIRFVLPGALLAVGGWWVVESLL
ncbi:MAG: sodium-dependent transporter [Longimicrobiales bacterium]|nr:sodium-dependent transporter [Longimicrobiales bacterium]